MPFLRPSRRSGMFLPARRRIRRLKPLFSGLVPPIGHLLIFFASSLALPSAAGAIENLGGIIIEIEPSRSPGDLLLLLDRVPLGPGGVPLCRKPSGKKVSVLAQNAVRREGEHSTFVVPPARPDFLSDLLTVGDCLTVHGRLETRRTNPAANDIRIVSSLQEKKKNAKPLRAFFLGIWSDQPSLPAVSSALLRPVKQRFPDKTLVSRSDGP
ncbi:hypothetical protein [Leptospirillum ferriphilum]|uniref:Uncharacterized protein n=1 Tax=Leptospirillum ferriphilum TaxID=178606 RepID=A0A1V3SWA0_9BACT|nr:hypothetical protein [Leptospirillum ferriphilum]MCL5259792.1 hypothetical protein [Nitrospirota bacterium]OOH72940.1 hypothetical protein BOX24_06055 [Leptospirillum ferriphilum]